MSPLRAILAPIDFSEPSRTALDVAARFARHTGAALHVLHAEDPLLAEAARQAGIDLRADTALELDRFIASADSAAALSPARHVAIGAPVDAILSSARALGAGLIVVGSRGMSGTERLVFGSTTEGVLRHANLSVLVTPPVWTAGRPGEAGLAGSGPIVAAVDFSPASVAAAGYACELASSVGTTLEIVHVVPDIPVLTRWHAHAASAVHERVQTARTELERLAAGLGCAATVNTAVRTGAVADSIADTAAPSGVRQPILVMGRRSSGERGGAPGTTAYRVLTLARVPVFMHVGHRA